MLLHQCFYQYTCWVRVQGHFTQMFNEISFMLGDETYTCVFLHAASVQFFGPQERLIGSFHVSFKWTDWNTTFVQTESSWNRNLTVLKQI